MTFHTINPSTGEMTGRIPALADGPLAARLQRSGEVQAQWRERPMADRVAAANRLAAQLRAESERYARLITAEMGKPIREARAEVDKCAWSADYHAAMAPGWLAPVAVQTSALRSEIHYCPLGLVLGIMPWNFPFWQVFRFAVPTLLAGNGVLVKHAPSVQGCAAAIEGCFEDAGFPAGLYANLPITVGQVEQVVAHPAVQAVTLTGSERAGRQVAALAGAHLKLTVLELGGSDPFVVLADADLDRAVATCLQSRLANAGQSCIGAKRIIVSRTLFDDFRDRLADRLSRLVVGDPMAETSDIGPMAGTAHRDHLHQQVEPAGRGEDPLHLGNRLQPLQDSRLRARFDGQEDRGPQPPLSGRFSQLQRVSCDDSAGFQPFQSRLHRGPRNL